MAKTAGAPRLGAAPAQRESFSAVRGGEPVSRLGTGKREGS